MRKRFRTIWYASVLAGLSGVAAVCTAAESYEGVVTLVRDGDSIQLTTEGGQKMEVRLHGIDAPERGRRGKGGQRFAEMSQSSLNKLALRQNATVETLGTDSYGRNVGRLNIATKRGPVDAGLMQVQLGMAWAVPKAVAEMPYDLRESYRYAEKIAKWRRRGLWADDKPQAPWAWRATQSSAAKR